MTLARVKTQYFDIMETGTLATIKTTLGRMHGLEQSLSALELKPRSNQGIY